MKKVSAVLVILFMSCGSVAAQGIDLGIRGGANFATFRGDTNTLSQQVVGNQGSSDFGRKIGLRVGGFLRFGITEAFSIRPEVTYSQKGTTFEGSASGVINGQSVTVEFEATSSYDYLDIPVLAEYVIPTSGQLQPYLFAGPSLGFSINAETEADLTARSAGQSVSETNTSDDDVESTDLGAVLGGGVSYALQSGNTIFLDIRYNPSFTSLDSEGDADIQNDVISVGVGYSFSLQ
ncbi:hypothetical protein BSZ35_19275 [Salinibacter sp. 10B]|uniref:porin family protein n=1 Tax=Salinibacter sp. 10B TaxID=1923971 RepID=UPI000CF402B0|nr:porin family protein [Salinibacter sp. 10B]PQJ26734.1 hypothetical protein BSZ35_19275 [Salinibacter sp. 10B]